MKVLVVGGGAREHALLLKLSQSSRVTRLFVAPGNAGMAELADRLTIPDGVDIGDALADLAVAHQIDLTVIGPEDHLVAGVADAFMARGLRVFGPSAAAARLEGSKIWAKGIMQQVGIPTALAQTFRNKGEARAFAESQDFQCVVKADGVARGKGSFVCGSADEVDEALALLLGEERFGGGPVLVEERLVGQEVSVFAISDGRTVVPFGAAQDHKRRDDMDLGPNTGGMGAYSPVEHMKVAEDFAGNFFEPIVREMAAQGTPFVGVLYAGAIVTDQGPKILEFNARFGDPEAEVLLTRLDGDLFEYLYAAAAGALHELPAPRWKGEDALCVVVASPSYPDGNDPSVPITGAAEAAALDGVYVFHAGTELNGAGQLVTNGGRVFAVTAVGSNLRDARRRAYEAVDLISFEGKRFRTDIASKADGRAWRAELRKPPAWEQRLEELSFELTQVARRVERLEHVRVQASDLAGLRDQIYEIKRQLAPTTSRPRVEAVVAPARSAADRLRALDEEFDALFDRMKEPTFRKGLDKVFDANPGEIQQLLMKKRGARE